MNPYITEFERAQIHSSFRYRRKEKAPKPPPKYKNDGGKWGYKDYRRIKANKKSCCELCGYPHGLENHHKDRNTRNSAPENLMTLCKTCHHFIHNRIRELSAT
jgi:5-methylcytosine-specific restriction endonuclease McrA